MDALLEGQVGLASRSRTPITPIATLVIPITISSYLVSLTLQVGSWTRGFIGSGFAGRSSYNVILHAKNAPTSSTCFGVWHDPQKYRSGKTHPKNHK